MKMNVNDYIHINGKLGKVLAISYSDQWFYYIEFEDKSGDWYSESFIYKNLMEEDLCNTL